MNTPFDLEDRLRETFDDIVPQLVARAQVATEIPLLGEPAPARQPIAGTPRRWSILVAVAAVVLFAGVVWVVSRPDHSGPGTPTASTTLDAEPDWYTALRPAVPERFAYIALTATADGMAHFVAIDPADGKELDILISPAYSESGLPRVECVVGRLSSAEGACSRPTVGTAAPFSDGAAAAVSRAIDTTAVLDAVQNAPRVRLSGPNVIEMIGSMWPDWLLKSTAAGEVDLTVNFGVADSADVLGSVSVVGNVYPRPSMSVVGRRTLYGDPAVAVFWVLGPSGVAVQVFTTDTTDHGLAQLLLVESLPDVLSVVPVESTSVPDPSENQGEPAWYTALRPYVPERFQYLALVDIAPDSAMFEAIDPNSPVLLRIGVRQAPGGPARGGITCDDGEAILVTKATSPCSSGPTPLTDEEKARWLPADELLQLAQQSTVVPIDSAAVSAEVVSRLEGTSELAVDSLGGSTTILFGRSGVADTEVHVVAGLYPRNYSSGGTYWTWRIDVAARMTTTLPDSGPTHRVISLVAVLAAQGRDVSGYGEVRPEWYTILREATPERFGYLAITRVEPHLATFVALDVDSGEVLDLIVRDVPGPAVEVTCVAATGGPCAFTEADTLAMTGDIPPGALGAAAREAMLSSVSGASDALRAAAPGWTLADVSKRSAADVTYRLSTPGVGGLTVRMIANVLPVDLQAVVHSPVPGAAWVVYGSTAVFVAAPADIDAAAILTALLQLDGN